MTKIVIIIRDGLVEHILGNDPENIEIEIIDFDTTTEEEDAFANRCLHAAEKELQIIY